MRGLPLSGTTCTVALNRSFPMEILLNGQAYPISDPLSLSELLSALGLGEKPVVAELNYQAILPRLFSETILQQGDRLEIITLAAGG